MATADVSVNDDSCNGQLGLNYSKEGEFLRNISIFRDLVTADGSSGFKAEKGRYHLYVSLACPWAHRTLILRKLKGLDDVITITVVDWLLHEDGWYFTNNTPKCTLDTVNRKDSLREIYLLAAPDFSGRFTVPCLWDKKKQTIVNNESSEILRMFNSQFNEFCPTEAQRNLDLYPEHLRRQIDDLNAWVYSQINNGVYRAGFARSQVIYDVAVRQVFDGLDKVEDILSKNRYLTGKQFTEADVRLFTSLVRFDNVYATHFKCNKRRIVDYPNMWGYVREIYQIPGVADTVDMQHIQTHYQVDADTEEQWTYAELKRIVRSIGSALSRRGLRKGDVVATCAPNVMEHAAILLAVPAIGGIPSGMNPLYTPAEIRWQCERTSAKYFVTTSHNLEKIREVQKTYKSLQDVFVIGGSAEGYTSVRELMADDGGGYPTVEINPREDLGLLPFSSGTTGMPKGVMLPHVVISTQVACLRSEPGAAILRKGDVVLAVFPVFHLAGYNAILKGLYEGCTLIMSGVFKFEKFLASIEKYKATVLFLAPSVLLRLAKDPLVERHDTSSLRTIYVAAAPVSKSSQQEIATRLNVTDIRQGYGMTEVAGPTHVSRGNETIVHGSTGKAFTFVQEKIVDVDTGRALGPDKSGELWVKTATVMKGYLNDLKATAELIDPNGWLHTGDIAYKDMQGNLFIVGRLKELIKYKGFQVAPAELEALLLTHPDVADAAVVGVPDERAGEVPRACVVLKVGRRQTREGDLQYFVNSQVAAFKHLRGGVRIVDVIPKNPSGKILRHKLLEREIHAKL